MNYLTGYTIKPYEITPTGRVIFTDGTATNIIPNQIQCEAYGYTYDPASGTCQSFNYNPILDINLGNINNKFNGVGNTAATGTNHIQINGTNNTVQEGALNCFISGSDNTIENGVKAATIVGSNGTAIRDGEFVIGAGVGEGGESNRWSTFFLSKTTVSSSTEAMLLNTTHSPTDAVIPRDTASIITYTIDVAAYRTGGASGSGAVGDRAFFKLQGILKGNATVEALTTVADDGVITGWNVASSFSGSDWSISVRGATGMNITWTAKANFYEMKL